MNTRSTFSASRLFRDLDSAERTAQAYRELVELYRHSARMHANPHTVAGEIFRAELARLEAMVDEHEADADDRRGAVLAAGYTPEQYDAWQAKR